MTSLIDLGPRICIFGPSASGKSTLAATISESVGMPAVHLDQLFHQPGQKWVPRPREEYEMLHAEAIQREDWVMDGNYSGSMPQRLARATGIIWIKQARLQSLHLYTMRSLGFGPRHGRIDGAGEGGWFQMAHHILIVQPRGGKRMARLIGGAGLPVVELSSFGEHDAFLLPRSA